MIDPKREEDVSNHVDSVLQTLNHSMLKKNIDLKLRREGTSLEEVLKRQADEEEKQNKLEKEYSLHKDCALAGFDAIARRPKKHLLASILWLIDFTYRKSHRKAECFLGDRSGRIPETMATVDNEYDEILDILKQSILENYEKAGKD